MSLACCEWSRFVEQLMQMTPSACSVELCDEHQDWMQLSLQQARPWLQGNYKKEKT